jgi:GT2 family glycosyltransferase
MKYFSNHFIGGKDLYYESYKVSEAVMGWCLVIKRESLNKLLPFDEIFDMYYQDNDYAENLKKHGIRHALARHSIACHLSTLNIGKYNENKKSKIQEDEIKFRSKWKV